MDRDLYLRTMERGIHRIRVRMEREGLDKQAFDFNEAAIKALEWLKNNWGKAGGAGLLALLGYGLGHKLFGPIGGLLGLGLGGFGGWFGGDAAQRRYQEAAGAGAAPQLTPQQRYQNAYNEAFKANRKVFPKPAAYEKSTHDQWVQQQTAENERARRAAQEAATKKTGYTPPYLQQTQGAQLRLSLHLLHQLLREPQHQQCSPERNSTNKPATSRQCSHSLL